MGTLSTLDRQSNYRLVFFKPHRQVFTPSLHYRGTNNRLGFPIDGMFVSSLKCAMVGTHLLATAECYGSGLINSSRHLEDRASYWLHTSASQVFPRRELKSFPRCETLPALGGRRFSCSCLFPYLSLMSLFTSFHAQRSTFLRRVRFSAT